MESHNRATSFDNFWYVLICFFKYNDNKTLSKGFRVFWATQNCIGPIENGFQEDGSTNNIALLS